MGGRSSSTRGRLDRRGNITPSDRKSVELYTEASYHGINQYLREMDQYGSSLVYGQNKVKQIVEGVDRYIENSDISNISAVYRGTDFREIENLTDTSLFFKNNLDHLKDQLIGKTYSNPTYVSTSTDKLDQYGSDVYIRFDNSAKNLKGADIRNISAASSENEVLLARREKYRITDVTKEGRRYVIHMRKI